MVSLALNHRLIAEDPFGITIHCNSTKQSGLAHASCRFTSEAQGQSPVVYLAQSEGLGNVVPGFSRAKGPFIVYIHDSSPMGGPLALVHNIGSKTQPYGLG